jgi:hypothetical protein
VRRDVALGIVCLSVLLGTNHLWAIMTDGSAPVHVNGFVLNLVSVIFGILAIGSIGSGVSEIR